MLDETRPKWRQIHAIIAADIASGALPPGARVPSVLAIQQTYGVALATAQKVIRALKADGLVRTEPGLGTFVAEAPERPSKGL
jgi:DNA-binding GntR family transcriptional regulator